MLAASTWISENIGRPVVGWWLTGFVLGIAVAWIAYEITGEVRRKRRIERREAGRAGSQGGGKAAVVPGDPGEIGRPTGPIGVLEVGLPLEGRTARMVP